MPVGAIANTDSKCIYIKEVYISTFVLKEVPYCFSRSSIKFQSHAGQKNHKVWPELSVSGL